MRLIKIEQPNCPFCDRMSALLDALEIPYTAIDISLDEQVKETLNIMGVPVLIVENEKGNEVFRTTGFNPAEINHAIQLWKNS